MIMIDLNLLCKREKDGKKRYAKIFCRACFAVPHSRKKKEIECRNPKVDD